MFSQSALDAVLQAVQEPSSFETKAKTLELQRMKKKFVEFHAYMSKTNPGHDWSTEQPWIEKFGNDKFGGLISTFMMWVVVYRETTISLTTLYQKDVRTLYRVVIENFPSWSTIKDPSAGMVKLRETSPSLMQTNRRLVCVFIARSADIQRAEPLYISDIRVLVKSCPPSPTGYRNAALLYMLAETGARGIAFTKVMKKKPKYRPELGRWMIPYPSQKRAGTTMTHRAHLLSVEGSKYFSKFYYARDLVDWQFKGSLFCIEKTEYIDMMLEDLCLYAGFPARFFTSHSGRAGKVTGDIANALLEGHDLGQAHGRAAASGDFGKTSDAMRSYIRQLADEISQYIGHVDNIDELDSYQLHSCLLDENVTLQGPFRYKKVGNNEGYSEAWVELVTELFDYYANKCGEPLAADAQFAKDKYASMLMKLGTMMDLQGDMSDATVIEATSLLYGKYNANRREKLLRLLTRLGDVDVTFMQNSHVIVSEDILAYLHLPMLPDGYSQHPKIRASYDASKSTDMAAFFGANDKRVAKRAQAIVTVDGETKVVDDMNESQKIYYADCTKHNLKMDLQVFDMLGDDDDTKDVGEDVFEDVTVVGDEEDDRKMPAVENAVLDTSSEEAEEDKKMPAKVAEVIDLMSSSDTESKQEVEEEEQKLTRRQMLDSLYQDDSDD